MGDNEGGYKGEKETLWGTMRGGIKGEKETLWGIRGAAAVGG